MPILSVTRLVVFATAGGLTVTADSLTVTLLGSVTLVALTTHMITALQYRCFALLYLTLGISRAPLTI